MVAQRAVLTGILAAAVCMPAAAADAGLLNLIAPDAKLLVGVHVDQSKNSPFGQFLLSRMEAEDKNFQSFVSVTGFDPRRDLREVVVAGRAGATKHGGLVAARGTFDAARILAHARAQGARVTSHQGVEILAGGKEDSHGLAFLNGTLAVGGEADEVRGAIDRWRAGHRIEASLAAKVAEVSLQNDAWVVTLGSPSMLMARIPESTTSGAMKGDVVQAIQEASGGVKFGTTVLITGLATTRSEKDATALSDVIRFLANMAQLHSDPKRPLPGEILNTLQLTTEANKVRMSFSVAEEQLEKILRSNQPRRRGEEID